ncbi:hypothetical protein Pan97_05800 [Bremerella volcania]|uniref:Twin-arginine translocation signal domain-containing protein n=1 Tax=Bremerella volcania TaxID=2527984 RepID=A0A518C348_9BACT|nr:hypothetical protein [Bremerella volcania]QDU73604.1 hypothetical protein Pan97_05800 [Bremerella volcania]
MSLSRRQMLQSTAVAGGLLSLGDLGLLSQLRPVSAEEAKLDPKVVRLDSSIEPLVRLIEETPREALLEEIASKVKKGTSYREVMAALLLVGVKNVEPRPSVGHKFHAVLVVNSAHLASMSSPDEHRWLPIFWALDHYKSAAQRDVEERGDWTMSAMDDSKILPHGKARAQFIEAMDDWDEEKADVAAASLARTGGANEIYRLLFRYGSRDYRSIGHKAIYVANSYRTLGCIGWQHAEPVLRSLTYALLMHEGSNPAKRDDEADRPFRRNEEIAAKMRDDWTTGKLDADATQTMIETLRSGSNDDACDQVVQLINGGAHPQSIWDALHVVAGEMVMQQPAIVPLHSVTTTNALRYAYETCGDDETRRLLLLQNAAFLPMFRGGMRGRGGVQDVSIATLDPQQPEGDAAEAVENIFAELGSNPFNAAKMTLGYLQDKENHAAKAKQLIDAARVLVFRKGDNAHDYKFSSAILEDYYHVSPQWRDTYLASNIFLLRDSQRADNRLVQRIQAALS